MGSGRPGSRGQAQPVQLIREHSAWIAGVAFSPDGTQLVTAAEDRSVALWRLPYRSASQTTSRGHTDGINEVAVSSKAGLVASGGVAHQVRLWDLASGQERKLVGHTNLVRELTFSADGQWLASSSWDRTARIWETRSGRAVQRFADHPAEVGGVQFGPERRYVITSCWDQTLRRWDPATGQGQVIGRTGGRCESTALSADGARLACGREDGIIELWDLPADHLILQRRMAYIDQIQAFDGGCATRCQGEVALTYATDSPRVIATGASALGWTGDRLLVAGGGQVEVFETSGLDRARLPADVGVSALTQLRHAGAGRITRADPAPAP